MSALSFCIFGGPVISIIRCAGDLDCSQGYHRLWLPDCSDRKKERCGERGWEPSRGFGVYRPAGDRLAQVRSGDRAAHLPSPPQRSQPKMPTLVMPVRARFIIDLPLDSERGQEEVPLSFANSGNIVS